MAIKATIEMRGSGHREVKVERVTNAGIVIFEGAADETYWSLIPWHRVWEVWADDMRGLPL